VDAHLDPLAPLQPLDAPQSLYLLNHQVWVTRISQADSGEYSHHMNNSFAAAGPLLDTLHLPECEGAEFELGIRAVKKRRKENGMRRRDSNT
jgi:hypothetical protein